MNDYESRYRIARKEAVPMEELVAMYIRDMRITAGLNRQRIFETWEEVSGCASYTLDKYFKDGVLYCRMSSSVARSRVNLQKDFILNLLNARLAKDKLYNPDEGFVKAIVLK